MYKTMRVNGTVVPEHRAVAGLATGDPREVHHKDLNPTNNAPENLEIVTHQQNCHRRGKRQGTTSKYIGVTWDKGKKCWRARIKLRDGSTMHLGYFKSEGQAAGHYDQAAIDEYGYGKTLNLRLFGFS
jgi:hypothetical protein